MLSWDEKQAIKYAQIVKERMDWLIQNINEGYKAAPLICFEQAESWLKDLKWHLDRRNRS